MVTQARADATRHMIMDAAVELFAESGYGNVALSDVIAHARVTRGACHYHFASKEALAAALITYADDPMLVAAADAAAPTASTLANLIHSTFAMAAMIRSDSKVRVGLQLGQSLNQISKTAVGPYSRERASMVVATVQLARDDGDLDAAVDADAVGHLIWCGILGNYFLADAAGADVISGLAKIWRVKHAVNGLTRNAAIDYAPSPSRCR